MVLTISAAISQGQRDDELPERLLGTVRLDRIDMEKATKVTTQQLDALLAAGRKTK